MIFLPNSTPSSQDVLRLRSSVQEILPDKVAPNCMVTPDSTTRTVLDLPEELVDGIFDYVGIQKSQGAQSDIWSCSLVCRTWRYMAQARIFHTVSLSLILRQRSFEQFDELLRLSSHVAQAVRLLIVSGPNQYRLTNLELRTLRSILRSLSRLEVLSLHRIRLNCPYPVEEEEYSQTGWSTLTALKLCGVESAGISTYDGLSRLLHIFSQITSLEIASVSRGRSEGMYGQTSDSDLSQDGLVTRFPTVKSITIPSEVHGIWPFMANWLKPSVTTHTLRSVDFYCSSRRTLEGINMVLPHLAPHLGWLTLNINMPPPHIYPFSANDPTFKALVKNLQAFSSMHSFTLRGYPCTKCDTISEAQQCMEIIACIISSLPACVSHLALQVQWLLYHEVSWHSLRVACRQLTDLKSVAVLSKALARFMTASDRQAVVREMKEFADRYILYVEAEPDCKRARCAGPD